MSLYESELQAALERTRARCEQITQRCLRVVEKLDEQQRRESEPPPA